MANQLQKPITLIATLGSSPAVLTEALYELHRKKDWPVDEVIIITTRHGSERIKNELMSYGPEKGGFYRLLEELEIPPHAIKIPYGDQLKAVAGPDGKELDDIRNREDDECMAAYIQQVVRTQCARPDRKIYGLMAGGRKTMGAHLMSAMQLFARPDDRLLHILVSEPFEYIRNFYYPTKQSVMLERKTITGDVEGEYDASQARIDLIDIPFIKLRAYLESQLDFSKPYPELVAEVDRQLAGAAQYPVRSLIIDLPSSCIYVNGKENQINIEARQLSIFALLAVLNARFGKSRDVAWGEIVTDPAMLDLLHVIYRTIKHHGSLEDAEDEYRQMTFKDFEKEDNWVTWDYWRDRNKKLQKRDFPVKRTQLMKTLEKGIRELNLPVTREHLFQFTDAPRAMQAIHSVPVPVANVEVVGLTDEMIDEVFEN